MTNRLGFFHKMAKWMTLCTKTGKQIKQCIHVMRWFCCHAQHYFGTFQQLVHSIHHKSDPIHTSRSLHVYAIMRKRFWAKESNIYDIEHLHNDIDFYCTGLNDSKLNDYYIIWNEFRISRKGGRVVFRSISNHNNCALNRFSFIRHLPHPNILSKLEYFRWI